MGVAAALMGAKMITDYTSAQQEYKSQAAAYQAQADAAQQNANYVARQREQQAEAYAQQQGELSDRMRLARGQARAAAGASGLASDSGSVADVLGSSQQQYEKDSLNLLQNQRNDSWSSYVNQINYVNQANAYNTAASNTRKQGRQKAFSTLLGNALSIYNTGSQEGWWSSNPTQTTTWVGNVPRSQYEKTGVGYGRYVKGY